MVLVTGGTGLVGSHLLYELVKNNQKVRAIYRSEEKLQTVKKVFSYFTEDVSTVFNKIEWIEADILDIPVLIDVFQDITQVYHCAALISFNPKDYHKLRKTNIEGTANIVNLCLAKNIKKLCYVSSIATLGNHEDNSFIDEETFWNPEADNSVYSITKYGAEMEVWRGTQEGLDAVIVNPGIIIGAGFWNSGSGLLFKKAHNKFPYYVTGTTGYVDVKDVVTAMLQLMQSNIINQRFVIVAKNISFQHFTEIAAKHLKVKAPKKRATSLMLEMAWRTDWLKSFLTGKPRSLTKQNAKTALTITNYSNQKIINALDFKFIPLEKSIETVSNLFLKEQ
ncbi:NAD-dependent epimerase/dehydratase family protein [Lacinutrix sp. MEBiC02404]